MKPAFINELSSSFLLFLDHEICKIGEGFINITSGNLYSSYDENFPNYSIYQSQYRQWVPDSSVAGATIASGIYNNTDFISKGVSGLKIDYNMGRVFLDASVSTGISSLRANYAKKDFNIFLTAKDEASLFLEDPYSSSGLTGVLSHRDQPYPLIYVKNFYGENKPFAFGGLDESNHEFRCIILSDSAFKLDALNSVLQDSSTKSFSIFSSSGIPFNVFGDFKSGVSFYNYEEQALLFKNNLAYIESVRVSKFDERVNKLIKDGVWGGFIDFKIQTIRQPRAF